MNQKNTNKKASRIPLLVSVGLLALGVTCYFLLPDFRRFCQEAFEVLTSGDQERTNAWVKQFDPWGPVVIILGLVIQMFLFIVPTIILMIVSVLAYGPWMGSLYALAGIVLASVVAYFIGHRAGHALLNRLLGERTREKFVRYVEEYGAWVVVVARVNPVLSNDTVSFASGIVQLNFRKFLLATVLATLPLLVLISYLGQDADRLKTGMIWISGVCAALALGYVVYREVQKRKTS